MVAGRGGAAGGGAGYAATAESAGRAGRWAGADRGGAGAGRRVGSAVLRAMGEAGLIEGVVLPPPPPFAAPDPAYPGPVLSEAQEFAAVALRQAVGDRVFSATLLEGVTGSGKTEVYLEAVARCVAEERQALVLLPEIALSAQWLSRFEARFGWRRRCGTRSSLAGAAGDLAGGGGGTGAGGGWGAVGPVPAVPGSWAPGGGRGARDPGTGRNRADRAPTTTGATSLRVPHRRRSPRTAPRTVTTTVPTARSRQQHQCLPFFRHAACDGFQINLRLAGPRHPLESSVAENTRSPTACRRATAANSCASDETGPG